LASIDKRIGWIGVVLLLCFVVLFVQLNNIQIKQAKALVNNPLNQSTPQQIQLFFETRGKIISANGVTLAYSRPSHDQYGYLRVYPKEWASMFSDITGYYANAVGANPYGVEASYNQYLELHSTPVNSLGDLLKQHTETDNVYLTISTTLQEDVMKSLNSQPVHTGGAIVVLDPRNGDILAMYSNPDYNPNAFAIHNPQKVNHLVQLFNTSSRNANRMDPLTNYAMADGLAPGSTFKIITTSAAFDHKPINYSGNILNETFPPSPQWHFPNCVGPVNACYLHNYGNPPEVCPSFTSVGLAQILAQSCDSAYGMIGWQLGIDNLNLEARSFGFDSVPPIDIPNAGYSLITSPAQAQGGTGAIADSAIGQFDDIATPLQMALVASAIADNGTIMAPHVVSRAVNDYGENDFVYKPHKWLQATSPQTASSVRQLMTGITQNPLGTATGEFNTFGWYQSGYPIIAAKTGTAEPGANTCGTYNWLVATGPAGPGQTPTIAAAAMIPVSAADCAKAGYAPTGATVAGPALIPVLEDAFNLQKAGLIG
jgi:peptidoglycan glycosyltransferase